MGKLMRFSPIGYVEEDKIVVDEKYIPALEGIEEFSHIIVVWVFSESKGYRMKVHPRGKKELPEVGLFATRTPFRPNPVAVSTVELVKRERNILYVKGLEAYDSTPVLDIKPYFDKGIKASFPKWVKDLHRF